MRKKNMIKPINPPFLQTAVISSFSKLIFIKFSRFNKIKHASLKSASKYYLTIHFFNKWSLDFRIMKQDNSFSFRCEQFYYFMKMRKNKELPF